MSKGFGGEQGNLIVKVAGNLPDVPPICCLPTPSISLITPKRCGEISDERD